MTHHSRAVTGLRPQTCKVCGRRDKFDFTVPDEVWRSVVGPEFEHRVVCLSCFDDLATERGVDYSQHLHSVYFAGEKAAIEFKIKWSVPSLLALTSFLFG